MFQKVSKSFVVHKEMLHEVEARQSRLDHFARKRTYQTPYRRNISECGRYERNKVREVVRGMFPSCARIQRSIQISGPFRSARWSLADHDYFACLFLRRNT